MIGTLAQFLYFRRTPVPDPDVNKIVIICIVLSESIPVVNAMVKLDSRVNPLYLFYLKRTQ